MDQSKLLECREFLEAGCDSNIEKAQFAEFVSGFLEATGYEQQELAYKIRVSPPTVHRWVNAKNMPYPVTANAIITLLIAEIDEMLGRAKMSA